MVGIGSLLALLALIFLLMRWRRGRLPRTPLVLPGAVPWPGPASVVALIAGWVTTEVGRQPWVVYKVMRTDQAVTGASGIPVSYGLLALAYLVLLIGLGWALRRLAMAPLPRRRSGPPTAPLTVG